MNVMTTWQGLTIFLICAFLIFGLALVVVGQGIKSISEGITAFRELFK